MNKGWARGIFIMLLMLSASFAYVIETGDGSKEFAESTAAEKCGEGDVQAVYMCLGNTVRVVSSLSGEGSTFYRPDGRVVHCPVVPPSEMGAECLQLMAPNYCPTEAECGISPAPEVFPGQNDTPEQTGDVDYYIVDEEDASDVVEEVTLKPESPKAPSIISNVNEAEIPAATPSGFDTILDNLVAVVLMLGIVSVGVLFMMFRTSLQEE
jgi:hypothetical protein